MSALLRPRPTNYCAAFAAFRPFFRHSVAKIEPDHGFVVLQPHHQLYSAKWWMKFSEGVTCCLLNQPFCTAGNMLTSLQLVFVCPINFFFEIWTSFFSDIVLIIKSKMTAARARQAICSRFCVQLDQKQRFSQKLEFDYYIVYCRQRQQSNIIPFSCRCSKPWKTRGAAVWPPTDPTKRLKAPSWRTQNLNARLILQRSRVLISLKTNMLLSVKARNEAGLHYQHKLPQNNEFRDLSLALDK